MFAHVFKAAWDKVPRDEKGRWAAISFGGGSFGVERVVETVVNGKTLRVSRGRAKETFNSLEGAARHADKLNIPIQTISYASGRAALAPTPSKAQRDAILGGTRAQAKDYANLKSKGYSDAEISEIRSRDNGRGVGDAPIPDMLKFFRSAGGKSKKEDLSPADLDTAGKKSPEQGYGKKKRKYRRVAL